MLKLSCEDILSLLKVLKNSSLHKNALYLIASTFLGAGTGFFFWIVAARLYPVEDFGLASAIISVIGLISSFSILGLNMGLVRYLPEVDNRSSLINTCITTVTIVSLILSTTVLICINVLAPVLTIVRRVPAISFLFILFGVLSSNNLLLGLGVFVGFRETKYSFIQTIFLFTRILILPILVTLGATGIFISFGSTSIIAYLVSVYILYRIYSHKIEPHINLKILKKILPYSFGNYLASLFAALPTYTLPILIINTLGAKANAYFYAAWMISYFLLTISENISTSLFAEGSNDPSNVYATAKKAFKFSLGIVTLLSIILFLFGKYILLIFGNKFEQESLYLLRILIFANIFYVVNAIYIAIKRVEKRVDVVIYTHGFLSVFTLILGYILIHRIGLIGICLSWLTANVIVSASVILSSIRSDIFH